MLSDQLDALDALPVEKELIRCLVDWVPTRALLAAVEVGKSKHRLRIEFSFHRRLAWCNIAILI
jgi:hypothetical protein